jgi:hypothetical protein
MRLRLGAAFRGGLAVAALTVGCGGRTADSTPPGSAESGASVTGSVSGSDAVTSGDASEATAGAEPTSGTVFGGTMSSGTLTAMSGTTAQASGTTAEASGTIETSGSVAPCSPNWFTGIGCESGSTATSGTTVATSGTVVATSGTFAGSGTLMSSSATTIATGACGAGASPVPVSFANDLMPIFQNNCSVGGVGSGALCHADPSVTSTIAPGGTRPYFGPPAPEVSSAATLTMIYEGLVNESSSEDISMSRVAPGEPTQSYLWYKINGIQWALENESPDACARGDLGSCGSTMPLPLMGIVVAVFPQSDRDLICNWITQGAPNN